MEDMRELALRQGPATVYPMRWVGSIGLAVAVGVAYFLAARLSLALLTKPDGVAVFWPASGVAAGVLIGLGPAARLPVAAGVGTSIDDFAKALDGRIQSMATAHLLLSKSRWRGVGLMELVRHQLAPYATEKNTTINGRRSEIRHSASAAVATGPATSTPKV
jgi:HWE histidine kinase